MSRRAESPEPNPRDGVSAPPPASPLRAADILRVLWRRRFALLIPLLVMIPLSIGAALVLPQKYIARSLILIQESDPQNPLVNRPTFVAERMQDRIAGMRALLKSDNVLARVVAEVAGTPDLPLIERNLRIMNLRNALELDNVGNNLLEFRLAGDKRDGLGRELAIVMRHFLETYGTASPYRTPERIVEIDKASDPTRPVRGRFITIIIGILSGLIIGVGLAVLLEYIDANMYDSKEIERFSGLPTIARMPRIPSPGGKG